MLSALSLHKHLAYAYEFQVFNNSNLCRSVDQQSPDRGLRSPTIGLPVYPEAPLPGVRHYTMPTKQRRTVLPWFAAHRSCHRSFPVQSGTLRSARDRSSQATALRCFCQWEPCASYATFQDGARSRACGHHNHGRTASLSWPLRLGSLLARQVMPLK